jgi:hypothetical protein
MISWGTTVWNSLEANMMVYNSERDSRALTVAGGSNLIRVAPLHPFSHQEVSDSLLMIWELLSGAMLWAFGSPDALWRLATKEGPRWKNKGNIGHTSAYSYGSIR